LKKEHKLFTSRISAKMQKIIKTTGLKGVSTALSQGRRGKKTKPCVVRDTKARVTATKKKSECTYVETKQKKRASGSLKKRKRPKSSAGTTNTGENEKRGERLSSSLMIKKVSPERWQKRFQRRNRQ